MKMRIYEVKTLLLESTVRMHSILLRIRQSSFGEVDPVIKEFDEELKKYSQLQVEKAMLEKGVL